MPCQLVGCLYLYALYDGKCNFAQNLSGFRNELSLTQGLDLGKKKINLRVRAMARHVRGAQENLRVICELPASHLRAT